MIGDFAVSMNGYNRFTQDVDILIEDNLQNRKAFRQALSYAGIGDFEVLETMDIIPGYTTIMLDGGMELGIFTTLPGYENTPFPEIFKDALKAEMDGTVVPFLHLNQLLVTKRASNRPKDRLDVEELEKIKKIETKTD
jgi:hypothetical protein